MDDALDEKNGPDREGREESLMEYIERLKKINEDTQQRINDILSAKGAREEFEEAYRQADNTVQAKKHALSRSLYLARLRIVLFFFGALLTGLSTVLLAKPAILQMLFENPTAITLAASGFITLFVAIVLGVFSSNREKTFVDIDDRLYSARVETVESEKEELVGRIRDLEHELSSSVQSKIISLSSIRPKALEEDLNKSERSDLVGSQSIAESKGFDIYMRSVIRALDLNIEIADNKASLLLDKGTNYLWRGIAFYIASIVIWQVVTANFKMGDYAIWGMVSCSMTFLVVEFLAAWFLRQYKSFTDSSFNLVRVKSIFNRYFLSYLAIKEFSDSSQHLVDMRSQMLKVLEEDIKWLEPAPQKLGEMNHMIAMFESVSGLVEKLKLSSKEENAAKPS